MLEIHRLIIGNNLRIYEFSSVSSERDLTKDFTLRFSELYKVNIKLTHL